MFLTKLKENLIELSADGSLKIGFGDKLVCDFWHIIKKEFKGLRGTSITKFFPSTFTYLCAQVLQFISINEERNRINAQLCFLLAVIFIHKHMNQLKMKPAPSISLWKAFPMKFIYIIIIYPELCLISTLFILCLPVPIIFSIITKLEIYFCRVLHEREINKVLIYTHFLLQRSNRAINKRSSQLKMCVLRKNLFGKLE